MSRVSRRGLAALVLAALILVAGLVLMRAWEAAQEIVHPSRSDLDCSLTPLGIEHEDVAFRTSDGLTLRGWWIAPERPDRAAVIAQPGYANHRCRVISHTQALVRGGYGVLTFDWRATGESDGDTATVGLYEARDVSAARDWLRGRDDVDQARVGALGQSAGAAAIIIAAAEDPTIAAIAAETPFATLRDMMATSIEQKTGLGQFPFVPLIVFFGEISSGASIDQVRPVDVIGRLEPRPVFIMRGGRDAWVPARNADLLIEAAGEHAYLWDAPLGEHSRLYSAYPEEYERRLIGFFDECFPALGPP